MVSWASTADVWQFSALITCLLIFISIAIPVLLTKSHRLHGAPTAATPLALADPADWKKFQHHRMLYFVTSGRWFWIFFLSALAANFATLAVRTAIPLFVCGLAIVLAAECFRRPDQSWNYAIAHNGLFVTVNMLAGTVPTLFFEPEIRRHRAFVSRFLINLVTSSVFCYLPFRWHIVLVSLPACLCWAYWHWAVQFANTTSMYFSLIYPAIKFPCRRTMENKEWTLYQLVEQERAARNMSEALETALRAMFGVTFDASCACDAGGILMERKTMHQKRQFGNHGSLDS
jgi:hypothetical protein